MVLIVLQDKNGIASGLLMKQLGLESVRWGRLCTATIASEAVYKPFDLVKREFSADHPNQLWVADITYAATWPEFVYVAFVIDVYSCYIGT